MRAYIATNIIGVFVFDNNKKILDYRLFKKDPKFIAERLNKVREGKIIPEEREIVQNLINSGFKEVIWDKEENIEGITCINKKENLAVKTLKEEFRKLAIDLQWVKTQAELNELLTKVNVLMTKTKLKEQRKDKIIIQVIGIIDDLDKMINTLSERLKEWYGLYFPESIKLIKSNEKFAEIISKNPKKEEIKDEKLLGVAFKSSGMEFSDKDLEKIKNYSSSIFNLFKLRKELSSYLEDLTKEITPNCSYLVGHLLTARLISLAGGLEKLAKLPSSTIQLLGAEKALFRHLKGKGKPPKHGVLFSFPTINQAPKKYRGKIARLLASKISIAARMDFYGNKFVGEEMKKEFEEQVKKVLSGE